MSEGVACTQTYGSGETLCRPLPHIHGHQRASIARDTEDLEEQANLSTGDKPDFVLSHPRVLHNGFINSVAMVTGIEATHGSITLGLASAVETAAYSTNIPIERVLVGIFFLFKFLF